MIISEQLRIVFFGIPRTANRAMHTALLQLPGAYKHGKFLHDNEVPKHCRSFFHFCCVRNPYRRFLAYYLWRKMPHPWGSDAGGMTFSQYIEAMEGGSLGPVTVRDHLAGNRLDAAIRYEELPQSFHELKEVQGIESVRLRIVGKKLSRHWKHYYDEELADRVFRLTKSEFDEFGYDVESWRTPVNA